MTADMSAVRCATDFMNKGPRVPGAPPNAMRYRLFLRSISGNIGDVQAVKLTSCPFRRAALDEPRLGRSSPTRPSETSRGIVERMGIFPVPPKTGNVSMDNRSQVTIYV